MWNGGRDASLAREIDDNDNDVKPATCPVTQSALFHPITLAHPPSSRSHLHNPSVTSAAPSTQIYFRLDWTDRELLRATTVVGG